MHRRVIARKKAGDGEGFAIDDTFSSDNISDVKNTISVSGGNAYGSATWDSNLGYHTTGLGSADHWTSANVRYKNHQARSAGVLFRYDPGGNTGYCARLVFDGIAMAARISTWDGTNIIDIGDIRFTGIGESQDTTFDLMIEISGTTISAELNSQAGDSTLTDSTYATGNYVGVGVWRDDTNDTWVEDIQADSGAAP